MAELSATSWPRLAYFCKPLLCTICFKTVFFVISSSVLNASRLWKFDWECVFDEIFPGPEERAYDCIWRWKTNEELPVRFWSGTWRRKKPGSCSGTFWVFWWSCTCLFANHFYFHLLKNGVQQFAVNLQVEGLMRLMEGEHVGPFNLGNPGEFTMLELAEVRVTFVTNFFGWQTVALFVLLFFFPMKHVWNNCY